MHRTVGAIVGALGLVAGVAIVAGVARYAFHTSDTAVDGVVWAAVFGMVALLALGGPTLAVLLGRLSIAWGAAAWLVAGCAFAVNVTNSLGAVSGRGDKTAAERTKAIADTRGGRERLDRLEHERAAMQFTAATADAVTVAREAVVAAERDRIAECGANDEKRGPRCRDRGADERARRTELATVLANRAATEKAEALDHEAGELRARLDRTPAVQVVNAHGAALAKLLRMEDPEAAATAQQVALVTFVELAIAFLLAASEKLLSSAPRVRTETPAEAPQVEPEQSAEQPPPAPIADTTSVSRFVLACLPRERGHKATWVEIFKRYAAWCAEQGIAALDVHAFGEQFAAACKRLNIPVRKRGQQVWCVDVRLVA